MQHFIEYSEFLKTSLIDRTRKLSKLFYAKTAHNNNVPLSLVEHESIHSPAWPAVKYLQIRRIHSLDPSNSRTAERIYKRGIMLFPLDPVAKR